MEQQTETERERDRASKVAVWLHYPPSARSGLVLYDGEQHRAYLLHDYLDPEQTVTVQHLLQFSQSAAPSPCPITLYRSPSSPPLTAPPPTVFQEPPSRTGWNQSPQGWALLRQRASPPSLVSTYQHDPLLLRALGWFHGYLLQQEVPPVQLERWTAEGGYPPSVLAVLGIQVRQRHPSIHPLGPSKEGVSIMALFGGVRLPWSAPLWRHWLHTPLRHRAELQQRGDAVQWLCREGEGGRQFRQNVLSLWRNAAQPLPTSWPVRLPGGLAATEPHAPEWRRLCGLLRLAATLAGLPCPPAVLPLWTQWLQTATALAPLTAALDGALDWERSAAAVHVRAAVDSQLDHLREEYAALPQLLNEVAAQLAAPWTQAGLAGADSLGLRCVFFSQSGFHVALRRDAQRSLAEQCALYGPVLDLEYRFHSESYIYFKNQAMQLLDSQLHDVYHAMLDRETEIFRQLAIQVERCEDTIQRAALLLAELDCFFNLASAAEENGLMRPEITEQRGIWIDQGWHPLHSLFAPVQFIPNDTVLGQHPQEQEVGPDGNLPLMEIISGPNGSGKSCYLQQVALAVYLAHIGSFVPARTCRLGLVDNIFVWAPSLATPSASVATGSWVQQIKWMSDVLKRATPRSLILLDEWGRGTNPFDGAALCAAILNAWIQMGKKSPMVVCATHLSDLWRYDMLRRSSNVIYRQMETQFHQSKDAAPNSLVCLYRLVPGCCDRSHAATCARAAGISSKLVDRASQIAGRLYCRLPILPSKVEFSASILSD